MICLDNLESDFDVVDTPGNEEAFSRLFINTKANALNRTDVYIMVYDVSNCESFKALDPLY
jgi:hypothetical protein